ncbi:unnamed protein product [Dovyalis caffra]|uniref:Uncharacterized protein n=1 Tax=Dovyalis caffra TaxID=77055 RepID=A0AAV1RYK6_9ROSI|nr:unnamed protein product [Dovyalis caffra]
MAGQAVGDMVVQLDLIFKVHRLEEADRYCYSLPDQRRTDLNGVEDKHLEKAEATMQTMKELGLSTYDTLIDEFKHIDQIQTTSMALRRLGTSGYQCRYA